MHLFSSCFKNVKNRRSNLYWLESVDFYYRKFSSKKTYYDVLGVEKGSTSKEIRSAYFELCKQLHPDTKPGDAAQHKKFIELNTAYSVLINPESRKSYDISLVNPNSAFSNDQFRGQKQESTNYSGAYTHWQSEQRWSERRDYRQQFYARDSLVPRVPKHWIIVGCLSLMVVGSLLYFLAYSFNQNYTSKRADEKSRRISVQYNSLRQSALEAGKDAQIAKLKKRWKLSDSSSPEE